MLGRQAPSGTIKPAILGIFTKLLPADPPALMAARPCLVGRDPRRPGQSATSRQPGQRLTFAEMDNTRRFCLRRVRFAEVFYP